MSSFKTDSIVTDRIDFNSMTTSQRDAMSPSTSTMVFNVDTGRVEMYTGSGWEPMPVTSDVSLANSQNTPVLFSAPTTVDGSSINPLVVGGISNDATGLSKLEGKTFQEIIQAMFFPTQVPTFSSPSASLTVSPTLSIIGDTISVSLSASYSTGAISTSWSPYTDDQGAAASTSTAGPANDYDYKVNNVSEVNASGASHTVANHVVGSGTTGNKFSLVVSYDEGSQMYDSLGNIYSTPFSAGSVSKVKYLNGTYPVYTNENTSNTTIDTQLPLVVLTISSIDFDLTFSEGSGNGKHSFSIPNDMGNVTGVSAYSSATGNYEPLSMSDWSSSATTYTLFSNTVNYTTWVHTGTNAGGRQYRITIS